MRTASADVHPNARLISIKCHIRAVSARVARGERSRALRGARNLWKFCKWPKSVGRSAGAAPARRRVTARGHPSPLPRIDGAEKFLKNKPLAKNLGVKFFWQPGEHGPCRPSAWLWQSILPQQRLFGTKLSMISTLDDICWKWSKRASNTSIVASLYRLTSTASWALEPRPANARHSAKQKCI